MGNKKGYRFPLIAIGAFLDREHNLKGREIKLLFALAKFADNDNWDCYPSVKRLTRFTNMSNATFERAKNGLVDKGVINFGYRTNRTNIYQINKKYIISLITDDCKEVEDGAAAADEEENNQNGQQDDINDFEDNDKVISFPAGGNREKGQPKQNEEQNEEVEDIEGGSFDYTQDLGNQKPHPNFREMARELLCLTEREYFQIKRRSWKVLNEDLKKYGAQPVFDAIHEAVDINKEANSKKGVGYFVTITSYGYVHKVLLSLLKEQGKVDDDGEVIGDWRDYEAGDTENSGSKYEHLSREDAIDQIFKDYDEGTL